MSRPPISRENSSHNLARNVEVTNPPPDRDAKSAEKVVKSPPPQLQQKKEANQPQASSDKEFSKEEWKKHGQGSHEQPAQQQPKEKSSQGDQEKSSSKQADTEPKGKAASSARKVNVPSLKLGGSGTATLKSRPPVPQTPPVSTSNAPASTRGGASAEIYAKGYPASNLTTRSKSILDLALVTGKIDPADLGYLMVEVQTGGFKQNSSAFDQGTPFMRAGLKVLNFKASDGKTHDSINLIEKFLEPMAERAFNTPECNELRKTLERNYLSVSPAVDSAARGMRPKEMQESEKVKNLMDPVIKTLTTWVCGKNENMASSQLPEVWKSLLLGIDDAVVQWAKNIQSTDMKEIKRLRSEALVAFISTRGLMIVWGDKLQTFGQAKGIDQGKFTSYVNSYFSHRANKFIADIMLSRKDLVGDSFDSKIRNYIKVLSGQKELISATPRENDSGRRQLMKSKTLQSTKAPPANTSNTVNDNSTALSPRKEVEKVREIKQQQSAYQRQKFVSEFSKLANLAKISPEFFRAFQTHVEKMSARAYEKFEQDPVKICARYIDKFYVGVLNEERQVAKEYIRVALEAITPEVVKALALAAEKVKSYVKPESEFSGKAKEISQERKKLFLGNFVFYTNIDSAAENFIDSFKNHILNLSTAEYLKFEAAPIASGRAYVDQLYSSLATTSSKADRDRLEAEKKLLVECLNSIPLASIKGLKDSIAAASKPSSDVAAVKLVQENEISAERRNDFLDKSYQATNINKMSTDFSSALDDLLEESPMPSSAKVYVKPAQERQILSERRNNFLDNFVLKTEIADLARGFVPAFKDYVLRLSTAEYLKFEAQPIQKCLDFVDSFYSNPFNTSTPALSALAVSKKSELEWYLNNVSAENLNAICSMAVTISVPHSTASNFPLQDSRITPAVKDAVSKKTESISVTEIVTESDSDANDAASEKTEES